MRVIFTIQHPAHVHFFRYTIEKLQSDGHTTHVFVRERPMALLLLDHYGIDYEVLAGEFDSNLKLVFGQLKYEINLIRKIRRLDPDVVVTIGEPAVTHASKLFDFEPILFTDTEDAKLGNMLAFPFANRIYTPECYGDDIGPKQVRYPGYHELAYLHPNRFEPDPSVLSELGLEPEDRFVILRLVDWKAAHDIGDSGFTDVASVVESLEETGVRVFITAEGEIPEAVERYQIPVEPHRVHHLMYYADLFIGESATMATESAVLGTPGIFVATGYRGYTVELEDEYGLVFNFSGPKRQSEGIKKGISILENYDQSMWDRRRQRMLDDKIDTTDFIITQILKHEEPR